MTLLRFQCNLKWPPWMNFIIFVGAKIKKIKSEIIHILQSPPYGNVQFILLKFEIATTSRFFKYL